MLEDKTNVTSSADLSAESKATAQRLLNQYVHVQGLAVSQVSVGLCPRTSCLTG